MYYVYLHKRKDNDRVFYVGKGRIGRTNSKSNRNKYWNRVASKHGFYVEIVRELQTSEEACRLEIALIKKIGLENLTNLTKGGEGTPGRKASKKTKDAMSVIMKEKGIKPSKVAIEASVSKRRKPVGTVCGLRFGSISDAVKFLVDSGFEKASKTSVSYCASGKSKTCYGYDFRYLDNNGEIKQSRFLDKKRKMISVGTRCGLVFPSISKAADFVIESKISSAPKRTISSNITSACRGRRGSFSAYGYNWGYMKSGECLSFPCRERLGCSVISSSGEEFISISLAARRSYPEKILKSAISGIHRSIKTGKPYQGVIWSKNDSSTIPKRSQRRCNSMDAPKYRPLPD